MRACRYIDFGAHTPPPATAKARHGVGRTLAAIFVLTARPAAVPTLAVIPSGVVVEEVQQGFAAAAAGLAPGDVITGWSRASNPPVNPEAADGAVETPFDLLSLEIEQAPRGELTLTGRRRNTELRWVMPRDQWRLVVQPPLLPDMLDRYEAGRRRIHAREVEEGVRIWEQVAATASARGQPEIAAWLLLRAADVSGVELQREMADALYGRAVSALEDDRHTPAVLILLSWGEMLLSRGAPEPAKERYERVRDVLAGQGSESLTLARALHGLGRMYLHVSSNALAETHHREALALRTRLAPDSIAVADSLNALGRLQLLMDDLASAEVHLRDALKLRRGPSVLGYAVDQIGLAGVAWRRGDYPSASDRLEEALPVVERLAPSSGELAYALHTAGTVALYSGNLLSAESYMRRAVQILRQRSGDDLRAGHALRVLSYIVWARRDYALAESLASEALSIFEAFAPRTPLVGDAVHALGDIARDRGDLQAAEEHLRRALSVDEAVAPRGVSVASDLRCLGVVLGRSGRPEEGERQAIRAAEILRHHFPGHHELAKTLNVLGELAGIRGYLARAENRYREALTILRNVAPGTREEAEAHHGLGVVYRRTGRWGRAAESFTQAIDALESQRGRLGGTDEAMGSFSAAYARYYQDSMESLVALGRRRDAFRVLERSRARSLLTMLADRNAPFRVDLPSDLAREWAVNDSQYRHLQRELTRLSPDESPKEVEHIQSRLRQLRAEAADIAGRQRVVSPRWAALHHPEPLDAAAASRVLDPGTVLLSFAVGDSKTLLFALEPSGTRRRGDRLSVFVLAVGRNEIQRRVQSYRQYLSIGNPDQRRLRRLATELYGLLLQPAETILARTTRIAISPDGPLHVLPFGALRRAGRNGAGRWLAEWKPIHVLASATFYEELRRERGVTHDGRLVAFGDPSLPGPVVTTDPRSPSGLAGDIAPLPFARGEVAAVAALFGPRAVAYVGAEATEARAKREAAQASYVHFACHARLDLRFPLNSSLILAKSEGPDQSGDDGVLNAWEIFDAVRLRAELVTLSGCQTALGEELGGEGLMSLTRAFHYAGARSVLSSLWSVSDKTTAELMVRFYRHLRSGRSKADALQRAQVSLIRSGTRAAHPFHWAAFALFGDWR